MPNRFRVPNRAVLAEATATTEVVFSRGQSIAEMIERAVRASGASIDAALYRFNSQRLAHALDEAQQRGVRLRLVIDHNKYHESLATRRLLANGRFPFRLEVGRDGLKSKMHHKFVLVDESVVLTGSYNWTLASEEKNHENLLVLRESRLVKKYRREFESLWSNAEELDPSETLP